MQKEFDIKQILTMTVVSLAIGCFFAGIARVGLDRANSYNVSPTPAEVSR